MPPMRFVGALYNWTDDLPKCERSGVGFLINQDYDIDQFTGLHPYEDRSFRFQCPDECYLYGVIDGHDGPKVSNFAAQKLPAELLLGQLRDDFSDDDVKQHLHESFDCLSKAFVEDLINDSLMEKIKLEEHLEGLDRNEAEQKYPSLFKDLKRLDKEIAGGCSAVLALVHKSKLFIANVGDSRALLCREDDSGDFSLIQLSLDHTVSTVSELQRIANIGIDIEKLQYSGSLPTTRSIGDWELKAGYQNNDLLKDAESEPVLSCPYVHGGEIINSQMRFLILMSAGVYLTYEEATGTKPNIINNDISKMVHQQLNCQASVEAAAQAVLDDISCLHYDQYISSNRTKCLKREDMTLLVRLFNMELGGKVEKPKIETSPKSKLLRKKSAKLAPLKMPSSKILKEKSSETDSPSSTGSSTPTSITVNEVLCSPTGSDSGGSMSPQFSQPPSYPYSVKPMLSPLQIEIEEEEIKVEEEIVCASAPLAFPQTEPRLKKIGKGSQKKSRKNEHQHCDAPIPFVMKKSGLYRPCVRDIQRDAGSTASNQSPDDFKASGGEVLHVFTDKEINYGSPHDSTNSAQKNQDKTFNRPPEPLETDQHGQMQPYVDFTQLNNKIKELGGEEAVFGDLMKFLKK